MIEKPMAKSQLVQNKSEEKKVLVNLEENKN